MKQQLKGYLNGSIAGISYGMNPLFVLPLYNAGYNVNSVLFYRYFISVILYFLWLKFVKKISLKMEKKEFLPLLILGIGFSFSSLLLFEAFHHIEAGIACTVLFTYPIVVTLIMAIFYKEKITKTIIFSILLTLAGIFLLNNGSTKSNLNLCGIICAFSSGFLYALYIVGVKNIKQIERIKSEKLSFYVMFFGTFVYVFNLKFCTELQIVHEPILWLSIILLSIFPTIISLETITTSIKLIGSTITSILGALEPISAMFFGVVFFHEAITTKIIIGVLMVLTGVIMIILRKTLVRN